MNRNFFIIFLFIFFFSCAQNRIELVKYKDFYNFGDVLKIKSLEFKPFPDNIVFKTKNTLIFSKNNKKYTFYSVIYSFDNYCRIFSYALFGKRVADIFFKGNTVYFVPSKGKEVYIINIKEDDLKESIFNFLKDIVKGIELKKVYREGNCYNGFYNGTFSKVCLNSGFRDLIVGDKEVKVLEFQNKLPKKIYVAFESKIMNITIKEFLKTDKNVKTSFFNSIKNFKRYYIDDLIKLEKAIFLESKNENK